MSRVNELGTDIHGVWEAKESITGKWFGFENIREGRNYLWMGIIAGVRQPDSYSFDFGPRGIPHPTSPAWQEEIDVDWMHGCTWLSPSEVKEANARFRELDYWGRELIPPDNRSYEIELTPDTKMTKLVIHLQYPDNIIVPWAGTIRDFIGEDADFEESVRMVCGFDS
jgi:hypothetical protein